MLSRVLRRLVPAALLALPVLGGLWATSGPITLAAPYPFPTQPCSTAQTGLGTGTAHAVSSGTVFFSPTTGAGEIVLGGTPQIFTQGGMSWNFTTQLTNDASGGGSMTASLRAVVSGVPGIGTLTFTPSCLQDAEVLNTGTVTGGVVFMQGTATGFGPVTAEFGSERFQFQDSSGPVLEHIFALLPPGATCQSIGGHLLLQAVALGGQLTASVSGGSEGTPILARYVSTLAPCLGFGSASPQAGGQLPLGNLPLPLPIALP